VKNKDLTIFSVYHKEFAIPNTNFIQPIQVGKVSSQINLGFIADNLGDNNIAGKNSTFSELTALYWIWKNLDQIDSKYVGLCHYRRYFSLPEVFLKKKLFNSKKVVDTRDTVQKVFSQDLLDEVTNSTIMDTFLNHLNLGKVIVPKAANLSIEMCFTVPIRQHYIYYHISEDWYLMREISLKMYPELENSFDNFFDNETSMHCYNMFISNKALFSKYCDWLFPILFELENFVKLSEYPYQRRIFGFFSERLFNLFLFHYKIEKAEFPVVFFT
jgi:hypothetical protein